MKYQLDILHKIFKKMSHNSTNQSKNSEKTSTEDKSGGGCNTRQKAASTSSKSANSCKGSLSDNNIKKLEKDVRDRSVACVKSWNCREMHEDNAHFVEKDLAVGMEKLSVSDNHDDFVANTNLLRARDSLEDLLKSDETSPRLTARPNTSRAVREKILPESHKSSPTLGESKKPSSVAKVLAWDPFEKVGRKSKDSKRKKLNKKLDSPRFKNNHLEPAVKANIDHKTGDEIADAVSDNNSHNPESCDYVYENTFQPKSTEAKEPLKRELEQQVRNKEMRRGHLLKVQENYNLCLF